MHKGRFLAQFLPLQPLLVLGSAPGPSRTTSNPQHLPGTPWCPSPVPRRHRLCPQFPILSSELGNPYPSSDFWKVTLPVTLQGSYEIRGERGLECVSTIRGDFLVSLSPNAAWDWTPTNARSLGPQEELGSFASDSSRRQTFPLGHQYRRLSHHQM